MKFLLTCGGSGGHINPALAIAEKLRVLFPEADFLFVGGDDNLEMELVPRAGFDIVDVTASSFRRGFNPEAIGHNILAAGRIANAIRKSRKIIKNFLPDIVIGTGGYVCYPVMRAAAALGIPTLLHASDVLPGLTIRLLEKHVDKILIGYEEALKNYRHPEKALVTGTPVRGGFRSWDRHEARTQLGIGSELLVVSAWGSLGAFFMNNKIADVIVRNENEGLFSHLHATGGGEEEFLRVSTMLREKGISELKHTELKSYIYDMPKVMAAADLMICRAGASTLNELSCLGKPAILIPSMYVTGNHQEKNAVVFAERGAALMIREPDCSAALLYNKITDIISSKDKLEAMSANMKKMDPSKATENVINAALSMIK